MKLRFCVPSIVLLMFCVCADTHSADEASDSGRLHRIDIKAFHPRAYHPSIGDLVQCYLDFPIVPEQIVDNLQITSATVLAVVSTSRPKIVGSGQISVYLMPRQLGSSKVTIQPVIPGQKPKPTEIIFLVGIRKER